MLSKIPVERFVPQPGTLDGYAGTRINYGIEIPLAPFDSGLNWTHQPESTKFVLNPLPFHVQDWRKLVGQSFSYTTRAEDENSSLYLGGAHNPVDIRYMRFISRSGKRFRIECILFCDFEFEGVGQNEIVSLSAEIAFKGLALPRRWLENLDIQVDETDLTSVFDFLRSRVALEVYQPALRLDKHAIYIDPIE